MEDIFSLTIETTLMSRTSAAGHVGFICPTSQINFLFVLLSNSSGILVWFIENYLIQPMALP